MSASRPAAGAPPPTVAPRKERAASSAPVSTSTPTPVTARMVSRASSVLTMLRRGAVPNTWSSPMSKLASRARYSASTRQATRMPLSESTPSLI